MAQAKEGDTVKVNYTGKLADGTVFDSNAEREPLEFTIGEGKLIPGFEQNVTGMSPGEAKIIVIEAKDAYGSRIEELVLTVGKDALPDGFDPAGGECVRGFLP